jgi:hypothetical protein
MRSGALVRLAHSGTPPLLDVLERLARAPHHEVVRDRPQVALADVQVIEPDAISAALEDFGALELAPEEPIHARVAGKPIRFVRLHDSRARTTEDTAPNRFVARFVGRLRESLSRDPAADRHESLAARLDLIASTLPEVSEDRRPSIDDPVLRYDPLYRQVVLASLALDRLLARGP